jgi:hypothetical protein
MTEEEFRQMLEEAIYQDETFQEQEASTRSFAEGGVLTMNEGLTVRLADGSEFQLTIVRSR